MAWISKPTMMVHSDLQSVFEKFERCAHQGSQGFTSAQQALAYAISSWDDGGGTRAERFTMACLQTSKGLFEYIYVTNDHVVDIVWSVLVEKYPKSFQDFIANPCLRLAFSRLLEFYMSLPPDADIPQDVIRAYRSAGPAMKVIEAIDNYMKAPSAAEQATPIDPDENRNDEEDGMGLVPKVKSKQAERKRRMKASARGHKQPGGMSVLDPSLFYSANYVPPSGIEDAAALGLEVVNDLKRVISDYLNGLVNINELIKRAYEGQLVADVAKGDNDPGESDDPREVQAEQNTPAAFPHIQPIRAAALFEDAAVSGELGEWHILISTRAFGQLRQLSLGDAAIFEIVKKKIRELSQGFFSDDNQKHLVGRDQEVPIFEAKMTRDLRLVYQVECGSRVTTEEHNMGATRYEQQQLRIYGIYTHAQLDKRFWASVAYQSIKRGKEYRRRCVHREIPRTRTKGYNVTPPAIFPYTPSTGEENSVNRVEGNIPIMEDSDYLALHEILALEKFIPYSHTLLDTVRQDQDASHIFSVSQKEEEIIYHPSSCLVIGRSGTGKTTTMLFKMIALEKAAQHSSSTIRQLFVTQSRVLAARVEEYFKNLLSSSFPSIYQSATGHQEKEKTKEKEKDLLELDDEVEDDSRLPAKWSDLEQRHFPLFITFDQLCKLLEGDCGLSFYRKPQTAEQQKASHRRAMSSVNDTNMDLSAAEIDDADITSAASPQSYLSSRKKPVGLLSFDAFLRDIWPHFDQGQSKGLDPALVFSEFMGVIRGSEPALQTENGYIDRATYEAMSERTQSTFAKSRGKIYSLFESYLKRKARLGVYDGPERSHGLLRSLKNTQLRKTVDFIYIDEVQDNLLLDAGLLHMLCRSPHGMFWAGDTAQTIALGSSFRFDDLKAYLYRLETNDELVLAGKRSPIHPAFFQLITNYRSHGGIVNAATSVVSLITKLFPHSIDSLAKEQGMVDGPKPVMFSGWGEDVRYEQFLFGEASSPIEFGAEQVILVRNEEAREHLRRQIGGEIGLILTLYESKGLEFNDVLLYNFFSDSTASANDWRVVLNALSQSERAGMSVPRFEELRHAAIQTELKFLYVGLTRARKHIWIWDSSEKAQAMQTFWLRLRPSLITLCGPNDPIPQIAVESTAADWAKSGRLLFQKRLYVQSAFCFEKAGMEVETAIALAYQRRVEARKISSTHSSYLPAWKLAASSFRQAAVISVKSDEKRGLFSRAAECFLEISDHKAAADSFAAAADYTNAAINYRKAGCFDDALHVIQQHRSEINQAVAERIIRVVKLAYTKSCQFKEAEKLFEDPEEYLEFLEDLGLDDLRLQVLENMQRFDEAASLAISRGEIIKGIDFYLRSSNSDSKGTALKTLIDALWTKFSLGNPPPAQAETEELMGRARLVVEGHSEIEMFSAIQSQQVLKLTELGRFFVDHGSHTQALLALDCALRNPPALKVETLDKVIRFLEGYQIYGQQVRSLIRLQDSVKKAGIQKLLNFKPLPSVLGEEPHEYIVAPSSILRPDVFQLDANKRSLTAEGLVLDQEDLRGVIRHRLSCRYNQSLEQLHNLAMNIEALQPCTSFTMFGECHRPRCSQRHVDAKEVTLEVFNKRVRVHIQIIMLLDGMIPLLNSTEVVNKRNLQRIWLERLFTALHPHTPVLGSLPLLNVSLIPEYATALPIIKSWLEERMFTLFPLPVEWRFRSYMGGVISVSLMAFTLDHANARNYAPRTRCSWISLPALTRKESQRTVIEDCLVWLSGLDDHSLAAGVLFLKHIAITPTLPVDVNALVIYTERLAIHLIFNNRSWIMYGLSQSSPHDYSQRTVLFVNAVGDLLDSLWRLRDAAGNRRPSNFIYEDADMSNISYNLRSLVISRLCRAIVLLGYNIPSGGLRNRILHVLGRYPDQHPHELFAEFVHPRHWSQLARAVRRTRLDSPNDELCQLVIGSESPGFRSVPGVLPVFFNSREELLRKMGFHISPLPKPIVSTLDPKAREFVPSALMAQLSNTAPGEEEDIDEETTEPLQEQEPVREALGVKPSEDEIAAADLICRLYRLRIEHRRSPRLGNHFFDRCLKESTKGKGGRMLEPRYLKYFLGPLPHLLAWLESAIKRCIDGKRLLGKKLNQVEHEAYDRMMDKINETSHLRRDLTELSRKLSPDSAFHRSVTASELKSVSENIVPLKERVDKVFGNAPAREIEDYTFAYKGLLQEAKPRRQLQPEKPSLNVEDLDYM